MPKEVKAVETTAEAVKSIKIQAEVSKSDFTAKQLPSGGSIQVAHVGEKELQLRCGSEVWEALPDTFTVRLGSRSYKGKDGRDYSELALYPVAKEVKY